MSSDPQNSPEQGLIPLELELYINPDGSVTFADLAADMIPLAQELNPDDEIICRLPGQAAQDAVDHA